MKPLKEEASDDEEDEAANLEVSREKIGIQAPESFKLWFWSLLELSDASQKILKPFEDSQRLLKNARTFQSLLFASEKFLKLLELLNVF